MKELRIGDELICKELGQVSVLDVTVGGNVELVNEFGELFTVSELDAHYMVRVNCGGELSWLVIGILGCMAALVVIFVEKS